MSKNFFRASAEDFKKIPGSPVAYWLSENVKNMFSEMRVSDFADTRVGLITGNNEHYVRSWYEVSVRRFSQPDNIVGSGVNGQKWVAFAKGGPYRRWYGNITDVVNWDDDGRELLTTMHSSGTRTLAHNFNLDKKFHEGVTWTKISSGSFSARYYPAGCLFNDASANAFCIDRSQTFQLLGLLSSKIPSTCLGAINPTLNYLPGDIAILPAKKGLMESLTVRELVMNLIGVAATDWDSYETSWDFAANPLVAERNVSGASDKSAFQLLALYAAVRATWARDCEEMRRLETENNRIFIEAYGLQDELTPEVPWHEITLTCNPWYRYGVKEVENVGGGGDSFPLNSELEERLKSDTVKELISYAVGCMMGRYSIEKPGLVLADQGASEADYYAKIGVEKSAAKFPVDDDGIIPVLDNDWFEDDIVTRFKSFVKVAFGAAHFFENMAWIEETLGKDIRSYFTKDFYKDHLQRYQNRPIYWMFQSPKGAFRALVYMHRYKPDMVGGVLGYLRSLQTKIDNQLDVAMQVGADETKTASERVRANKDAVKYAKAKKELDEYEKNILYPLSTERIEIDLDDGVKVNYAKFASALTKVKALEGKGE